MKIINWLSFLILTGCYVVEVNAGNAPDNQYKIQWYSGEQQFSSSVIIQRNQIQVYGKNDSLNTELWLLKDGVTNCPLDVALSLVTDSFEVIDLFGNGEKVVLFAYKIGCVGGIDPVTVKYFAYYNGIKHALRGEEHIIIGDEACGGEEPPVPGENLKNNKVLLDYMLKKWPAVSLRKDE